MSPFRWDVVGVGFVLALPLLAIYLRGDLSAEEMTIRLPWCLVAGYLAVALIRYAGTPRTKPKGRPGPAAEGETALETEHSPAA